MRPTTAQLEALVAVAESGSISRAASALGLAQPTVSATLRRLERQSGAPLLERTASGTRLTAEGDDVVRLARAALAAIDDVGTALAGRARETRPVAVAASYTVAEQLLPVWLRDCPVPTRVEVCNSREVQASLEAGRVEIGFVEGVAVDDVLRTRVLARDELVLVVAPSHPWAGRSAPVSPRELVEGPDGAGGLVLREQGSGAREVLELTLAERGCGLPAVLQVRGSTSAVLTSVRFAGEHGVVPVEAVAGALARGELVRVPLDLVLRRELRLVLHRRAAERPGVAAVVAHVVERARRSGGRE